MTPRFAAWLSGLLLLALASGMTSAEAGDKIKIGAVRVASPLFVAQERGYFQAQVKPLQSNTTVMAALAGNTIDAAVMPATVSVAGLARNEAKLLGWVSDIGEPFLHNSAVLIGTKTANERGDLVKRFLVAYRGGTHDFHDAFVGADGKPAKGRDHDAILAIEAKYTGVAPDKLMDAISYVDAEGRISSEEIARQIAWYKAQGLLKGEVSADRLIDTRYVVPLPEK